VRAIETVGKQVLERSGKYRVNKKDEGIVCGFHLCGDVRGGRSSVK
jgi:hypothetical protein